MLSSFIKIARRQLVRNKVFALINISGLAIGIATCLLIYLWIQDELGYDDFHTNADNLYRVVENQYYAGGEIFPVAVTPAPLAPTLLEDFPAIINATRTTRPRNSLVEIGAKKYNEADMLLASPAFFEMFTFPFLEGDPLTALDEPNSVVISRKLANKYFGSQDAMGQTIRMYEDADFKITGVMADVPENSHLKFSLVIPFLTMKARGANLDQWGSNSFFSYVELQPQVEYLDVNEDIIGVIKSHNENSVTDIYLQPLSRIHLHSDFTADIAGHGNFQYVLFFAIIAFIILIIAEINFMNLSTARSANRAKEVGIRKVLGAIRSQLSMQFLGESILLTILALGVALVVVALLLPAFNNLASKNLSIITLDISQLSLIGGAVILTGLISGIYPAAYLSAFQPIQVLRGTLAAGASNAVFRKVLVVVQFSLAICLIIGAIVVNQQLRYIKEQDLGYEKDNMVFLRLDRSVMPQFDALRNKWEQVPGVLSMTRTSQLPTYIGTSTSGFDWEGRDPELTILMHYTTHDYFYQQTLGLEMAAGRFYSQDYPSDSSTAVVINEKAAQIMGYTEPIGKGFIVGEDKLTVIGVVKDFHFKSIHKEIEPLVMFLTDQSANMCMIKLDPQNLSATLASLETGWNEVIGDLPFDYGFLDEAFDQLYMGEQRMGSLFQYFSILAIFISCLGLYGLSLFMTEQRTKEIGVRKVLGASVARVAFHLVGDFSRWVLVANLLAWPLSWLVMSSWLKNFAYRVDLGVGPFIMAGTGTLVLALVTVGYHSVSAALANPAVSLRSE